MIKPIAPLFAIAKYVPDIHRMEPRNIGVIVWADGMVASRFLGETRNGNVNPPPMVSKNNRHAYRQWITYWKYQLDLLQIRRDNGEVVPRDSPEFLDALKEKSKEHFRLVSAGRLLEGIQASEIGDFTNEMFGRLVESEPTIGAKAEAAALMSACTSMMDASGIRRRPDYRSGFLLSRRVHGVFRPFPIDYALGPMGSPLSILQRVLLTRHQSVDSNAFMFDALMNDEERRIPKENCVAMVNKALAITDDSVSGLQMLENMVTVVDVSDLAWATVKLQELSSRIVAL